MRVPKFSLPVIIAGFALTFLFAGSLSAKERGWYLHGGLFYWNDVHRWDNEDVFVTVLPSFSTTGWRRDSSASQLSFGVGFNVNKNWAIEVLRSETPDLMIPGNHWLIPPIEQDDEPVSASWVATKHDGDFFGLSVIYDHYLSERVSVFLKVGGGSIGAKTKLDSTLIDSHRVLLDEQIPDSVLLGGQRGCDGCSLRSGVKVYAVGMRMPLLHYTKVSVTFAYQFVRKDIQYFRLRHEEVIPPMPRETLKYPKGKTSSFEIGIQLRR